MTSDELRAIRARLANASDGPWSVRRIPNSYESQAGDRHTHPCVRGFRVPRRLYNLAWQQCETDAEFMAQARQDIPNLLAEVEQLRSTLRDCRRALGDVLRKGPLQAEDIARIEGFIAEEAAEWEGGADGGDASTASSKVRRLYVTQPPLRPKDAIAALTKPRKVAG
ncbi:MAG: hypothetical protein HY657_13040 [Acidobacteria bacterium]|nr:hypothetical protein [Acidobacteriota bacterium]